MRKIFFILTLSVSLAVFAGGEAGRIASLRVMLEDPAGRPVMVIAHRACWRLAPENSIAAIKECIRQGVDMIEIDVRETRDGYLVLMHDDTVDRTTNGSGAVSDLTLAEIQALRLKEQDGGLNERLTISRVPTLEEALLAARGELLINLDIKEDLYHESLALAEQTGTVDHLLIKMAALPDDERLRSATFHGKTYFMPIVRQCREEKKEVCSPVLSRVIPAYVDYGPVAYEIVFQDETYFQEGLATVKQTGVRLWVNTLQPIHAAGHIDDLNLTDPDSHWGRLINMGANMIQTDRPQLLIEYLTDNGYR